LLFIPNQKLMKARKNHSDTDIKKIIDKASMAKLHKKNNGDLQFCNASHVRSCVEHDARNIADIKNLDSYSKSMISIAIHIETMIISSIFQEK